VKPAKLRGSDRFSKLLAVWAGEARAATASARGSVLSTRGVSRGSSRAGRAKVEPRWIGNGHRSPWVRTTRTSPGETSAVRFYGAKSMQSQSRTKTDHQPSPPGMAYGVSCRVRRGGFRLRTPCAIHPRCVGSPVSPRRVRPYSIWVTLPRLTSSHNPAEVCTEPC